MMWCDKCNKKRETETDHSSGCSSCGKVLVSDDVVFIKSSSGQIRSTTSSSYTRASNLITTLSSRLSITDPFLIHQSLQFYQIACERNFTRRRLIEHVTASCLYLSCRANNAPYLLIDFASQLLCNVYVLGGVYLELCKLLSMDTARKTFDPSLFIHRYASALLKERNMRVACDALRIVASMKRDWIVTGRMPGGICGASVYVAAVANGFRVKKEDVLKVVNVCEVKRLVEFGGTESGGLTVEEFVANAKEMEEENVRVNDNANLNWINGGGGGGGCGGEEVVCVCKEGRVFCHGLCRECYKEFVEISGGLSGGANPPAFERAEVERLMKGSDRNDEEECDFVGDNDNEELSDFEGSEVDEYINDEKEVEYRRVIWEAMNKEYLEEQAAKKAAAEAGGEGMGKMRKRRTRDRKGGGKGKNGGVADTAAEAAKEALSKKRLSSLINFDALEKLFGDDVGTDAKKARVELSSLGGSGVKEQEQVGEENELADGDDGEEDDFDDGNVDGENGGLHWYTEDGEEGYDDNNDDYEEY